jgi:hypothetical protein
MMKLYRELVGNREGYPPYYITMVLDEADEYVEGATGSTQEEADQHLKDTLDDYILEGKKAVKMKKLFKQEKNCEKK